ncbi:S-adenosyl-L-methionine-dependent methyltransferase [Sphaerisporangium rufum]|uniref:S-adenosyl-L-methionine-dependent methyltransferase n=2 Tax=Sphaerisporangium rufum TaxID=1381558 RepID=A0A919R9H1_9ACTN|nr:S-adenosyl-L-methionine-dependent methyltransferase [Sphaerisporangium rufum]
MPSRTALTAAAARAAHLIVDAEPHIFADTLALPLLGDRAEELVAYHRLHGTHPVLAGARLAATTRGRFTEDRLAAAVARGTGQYVVLGAGLDSYAYRAGPGGPRVFEVDHPATQDWKRAALAAAGIAVPPDVVFVPADLERDPPVTALARHGFDPARPAFVSWLGVTMYLTPDAVGRTLAALGGLAPGTEVVLDHMVPEERRDELGRMYAAAVAPVAAEGGEPWRGIFAPEDMAALLAAHGFAVREQAWQGESVDAALWDRSDALRPHRLPMLTRAAVTGVRPAS